MISVNKSFGHMVVVDMDYRMDALKELLPTRLFTMVRGKIFWVYQTIVMI